MTCQEIQRSFSLYLYGELDFDLEEAVEQHLHDCALCTKALGQERAWHAAMILEQSEPPLALLSKCREDLRDSIGVARDVAQPVWLRWVDSLGLRPSPWSMRLATASLLICLGFGISRLVERGQLALYSGDGSQEQMSILGPAQTRVRFIEPQGTDGVQLVVDEIRERVIAGSTSDDRIRRLLFTAAKDPTDPGLRVESMDILKSQPGDDVRDALLDAVTHDPNAGVRLKALQGLTRYTDDPETRHTVSFVLSHDENPDVRTQAIDLLVPSPGDITFSPQLAGTLQELMRTERNDYIRNRCQHALHAMNASVDIY